MIPTLWKRYINLQIIVFQGVIVMSAKRTKKQRIKCIFCKKILYAHEPESWTWIDGPAGKKVPACKSHPGVIQK
jgi:hypothetical protein